MQTHFFHTLFVILFLSSTATAQQIDVRGGTYTRHFAAGATFEIGTSTTSAINNMPGDFDWSICMASPSPPPPLSPSFNTDNPTGPGSIGECTGSCEGFTPIPDDEDDGSVAFSLGHGLVIRFFDIEPVGGTPGNRSAVIEHDGATFPTDPLTFEFTLQLEGGVGGGISHCRTYRIIHRRPLNLVFVLDKSGSMDVCASGTGRCDNGCSPASRWCNLTTGMELFLSNAFDDVTGELDTFLIDEDLCSVIYFDEVEHLAVDTRLNGFISIEDAAEEPVPNMPGILIEDMRNNVDPQGSTSIGNALIAAINRFNSSTSINPNRVLFIGTDGNQNTTSWILGFGSNGIQIAENRNGTNQRICTSASGSRNCADFLQDYRIIAVTANPTPSGNHIFSQIPAAPAGDFNYYGSGAELGMAVMRDAFNEVFSFSTPEYILIGEDDTSPNKRLQFPLNEEVTQLILSAITPNSLDGYRFTISQNGVVVPDSLIIIQQQENYALFKIIFQNYADLSSAGNWEFRAISPYGSSANINLQLAAVADDHRLKVHSSINNEIPTVNEALLQEVNISYLSQAVSNAEVFVRVVAPGDELQKVLAEHDGTTTNFPSSVDITNCANQKYYNILTNAPEKLNDYLDAERSEFRLIHQGNGRYTNSEYRPPFTGDYQLLYTISFTNSEGEQVARVLKRSMNVIFSEVETNAAAAGPGLNTVRKIGSSAPVLSDVYVERGSRPSYAIDLGVKPLYQNPRLGKTVIGPGYDYGIHVQGTDIYNVRTIDRCDGSYQLAFQSNKRNPKIEVQVLDQTPYKGRALFIDRPYLNEQWGAGIFGGVVSPRQQLDTLYDDGYYLEAGLGYRFARSWGMEILAAQNTFRHPTDDTQDLNIISVNALANIHLPLFADDRLGVMVRAGGGLYFPDNEDMIPGYVYGGSANYRFGSNFYLFVDTRIHTLTEMDYKYLQYGTGFKFRF